MAVLTTSTPWRDWLVFAVTELGFSPAQFWQISLREWQELMRGLRPVRQGLTNDELNALIQAFPDEVSEEAAQEKEKRHADRTQ